MGIDSGRIKAAVTELLLAIGADPARPGLSRTPSRIAELYAELFSGVDENPLPHLRQSTEMAGEQSGELVLLKNVAFISVCEHHLLPFSGQAHLAYLPDAHIVGLSRLIRVVETLAARLQLQERLGEQIADTLMQGLTPRGALVILEAQQQCVTMRERGQQDSRTVTVAARGELRIETAQAAIFALIGSHTAGTDQK